MLSFKTKLLNPKSHRQTRALNPPLLRACPEAVDQAYLSAYQNFICNFSDSAKICVETMIIPPAYEQIQIIKDLNELGSVTDIAGFEGVFMRLMLVHDTNAIDMLIKSIEAYNSAEHLIDVIIKHAQETAQLHQA